MISMFAFDRKVRYFLFMIKLILCCPHQFTFLVFIYCFFYLTDCLVRCLQNKRENMWREFSGFFIITSTEFSHGDGKLSNGEIRVLINALNAYLTYKNLERTCHFPASCVSWAHGKFIPILANIYVRTERKPALFRWHVVNQGREKTRLHPYSIATSDCFSWFGSLMRA